MYEGIDLMRILGINAYHGDASAALVINGNLVAAAEEERFRRIKHWAGFPEHAIRYCLEEAKLSINEIDAVAINQNPKAHFLHKIYYLFAQRPSISMVADRFKNKVQRQGVIESLKDIFEQDNITSKLYSVEHHLAHLASAHLVSPFEQSVAVSVDGFGDFSSTCGGLGSGQEIKVAGRVYFPHSLGVFYQALTQYLGFTNYGDEYKVMGLAPYGKPVYLERLRKIVLLQSDGSFRLNLKYFLHHRGRAEYTWNNGEPLVGKLFSAALEDLLGPARQIAESLTQHHRDIARSVQAMYEEAFFHLLNALHQKYQISTLTLAGGCAMNSVANGRIYENTPFKKLYIQSAAGDAGGAIGAAFVVASQSKTSKRFLMNHANWGPHFSDQQIDLVLKRHKEYIDAAHCSVEFMHQEFDLLQRTAQSISEGKVIGWFQGRMEWGPRALGNRSILADPRRADMKDILNLKIKRRESFRPFAPSVLRERVKEWFEIEDDVPFMMQVYSIRPECRLRIPAVTHVDGSGRLQTVEKEANSRYWSLINSFYQITGVPLLLNTSFNENEPVVCAPQEALNCFLRTKMDILVLGNYFIHRPHMK